MIGIKAIASYIPETKIDNKAQAEFFGETENLIKNKIGAYYLPRKDKNHDTSDMAVLAIEMLFKKYKKLSINDIEAIVVVTQNPDGYGLPHTSAIVQNKLNLNNKIAAFDVSLGCSGYVYGLNILKGFLKASNLKNGVLVTADPYSKILDPNDKNTSLLFGDASTATLIGESPTWKIITSSYGTDGAGSEFLKLNEDFLHMNGRMIYNFVLKTIAKHIEELLKSANLEANDIDIYCLHQGSATIIDAIAKNFKNIKNRFINDMSNTGNTVSSSIPLLLEHHAFNNIVKKILICGFGVGLSWASAIIEKVE